MRREEHELPKIGVGIDLGTTHSCMGVWRNGQAEIIPDAEGNRLWPSVVAFTDRGRRFGAAAQPTADSAGNPSGTLLGAKRFLARQMNEPGLQRDASLLAVSVHCSDADGHVTLSASYAGSTRGVPPVQVCAMLLARMKARAEEYIGDKVDLAVLTVPAYFNQKQRCWLLHAATVAGLEARLSSDGGVAGLACMLKRGGRSDESEPVLTLDVGGGGLNASLCKLDDGIVEVAGLVGDPGVGGIHFDARLVQHCRSAFLRRHGIDLSRHPRAMARLRAACERAKRELSAASRATIALEELAGGHGFVITIARSEFEEMCEDLLQRCSDAVDRVLELAGMTADDVAEVLLLGGCSRVHAVRRRVLARFPDAVLCGELHAEEAVVMGATAMAAILGGRADALLENMLLLDAYPLAISVGGPGGDRELAIPASTTVPTMKEVELLLEDTQQGVLSLTVCEHFNHDPAASTSAGTFEWGDLPPLPAAGGPRRVLVAVGTERDGLWTLTVKDITHRSAQLHGKDAGEGGDGEANRHDGQAVQLNGARSVEALLSPAGVRRLQEGCRRFDAEDATLATELTCGGGEDIDGDMEVEEAEVHPHVEAHSQSGAPSAPPFPSPAAATGQAAGAAPATLWCPITNSPIRDPVKASDGCFYEQLALTGWIAGQRALGQAPLSPITGEVLQLYGTPA